MSRVATKDLSPTDDRRFVVLGTGGHAREVAGLIALTLGEGTFYGFVSESGHHASEGKSLPVVGDDSWLAVESSRVGFLVAAGSGFPRARKRMMDLSVNLQLAAPPLVHPTAVYPHSQESLPRGLVVCAGAIISCDTALGDFGLINWNVTIGHDTSIGQCSVINPGANIGGDVHVGERVLVGAGAQVLQGLSLGDGAIVGAGAVVTRDVNARTVVAGVPARVIATVSDE